MDAKMFLAEFGHIANAPGGVQCLREMVLQLAIQGKLVPPLLGEDSAIYLLNNVRQKKKHLINEKKIGREKLFPEINESELPTARPNHWEWPRFGEMWQLISGRDLTKSQYNESKHGIPYITGASNIDYDEIIINRWTEEPAVVSIKQDLLISCKGTIGKTVFNKIGNVHIARQIMAIRGFAGTLNTNFLKIWLDGFVNQLEKKSKSMIPGFSRDDLLYAIYPLPPHEEQKRIVKKVDELMKLCDKLETKQEQRNKLNKLARIAALDSLANAQNITELMNAWHKVSVNFHHLFVEEEDVWLLKQVIMDLGMSGFYINSNSRSSNTGLELLKNIENSREHWEAQSTGQENKEAQTMKRKIKKQKVIYPQRLIPNNWTWGTFLQISKAVIDCHNKTAPYVENGIDLVRTSDIRKGVMDLKHTKKITQDTYEFWARRMPPEPNDIFFTREAPMGEAAIVPHAKKVCLGQRTLLIRLFPELYDNQFLLYAIYSPSFIQRMITAGVGATVKHLRVGDVESLLVPVPPIEEQKVTKTVISKLINICDKYAEKLSVERRLSAKLANVLVANFTGQKFEEVKKMKAPKTELVSQLRLNVSPANDAQAPLSAILIKHNGELSAKALWNYSGLDIQDFYQQLKIEMANRWIVEPEKAGMRELEAG